MSLATTARLGPYEILGPLGAGGMGEVYRATDTRLGRTVALKVLPEDFLEGEERKARFEREARLLAALNHPNIAAVHSFEEISGRFVLVQELLEGESLREKLGTPLPPRKAVEYAVQVAHGLAAAHEKGIVHRDLKPENLFVTKDGRIKILDFGVAKLVQPVLPSVSATEAPTAAPETEPGVVMGTVGYMSPEQVLAKPVDSRSDLFSLGVVLYEMLSGKRPFQRKTAPETMAAILREEPPDLSETNKSVPPGLDRIVRHCLEKEPSGRFESARDVAFALESLSQATTAGTKPLRAAGGRRRLAAAMLGVAILLVLAFLLGRRAARPEPLSFRRLTWRHGTVESARFAPDGKTVLYSASWDGKPPAVFIKHPDSPDAAPLDLPSASLLAISSSGELAIQTNRQRAHPGINRGTLARVALTGGTPRELAENVNHVDWGPDGSLVAARDVDGKGRLEYPLGKVLYETDGHVSHPRVSPRGDLVAFADHPSVGDDGGSIAVVDLHGKKRTLTKGFASIQGLAWSPSGKEIWFTAANVQWNRPLWAVTLGGSLRKLAFVPGDLRLQDVTRSGGVLLSRGEQRLAIRWLGPPGTRERELSWFGWSILSELSGDGTSIVFTEQGEPAGPNAAVCVYGTSGSPVRLGEGMAGALSPDGRWVTSQQKGEIVLLPRGAGESRPLSFRGWTVSGFGRFSAWLPDGKRLVVHGQEDGGKVRLFVLALEAGKPRAISPDLTPEGYRGMVLSPDGRLVAARGPERKISLYPVDGGEPRSAPGMVEGDLPLQWSGDGRSLYVEERLELYSPARVFQVDLGTGERVLWKELFPEDPAGVVTIGAVRLTPDGRFYAYNYYRHLSDLYLVEGLR